MRNSLVFLIFLICVSLSYSIKMIEPFEKEVSNGEEIYLGEIGPGQTIAVSFIGRVKEGGIFNQGGAYEIATVQNLPKGWSFKESDWIGNPLQIKITANKYAQEGFYTFYIKILDSQPEGLENITLKATLKVTYDILDVSIDANRKEVSALQPARFYLTITNKANTGDVFLISSKNVGNWKFVREIYIPPKSSKVIQYEIFSEEEETFYPQIYIESLSSPLINTTLQTEVIVNPSPLADIKAINNGVVIFPNMLTLIYSFIGLISNLL